MNTLINGTTYLLSIDPEGGEDVVRYFASEMAEIFTDAERADLTAGKPVLKVMRHGQLIYVDMVAAARDAFTNA